jgi:hypothetical protein
LTVGRINITCGFQSDIADQLDRDIFNPRCEAKRNLLSWFLWLRNRFVWFDWFDWLGNRTLDRTLDRTLTNDTWCDWTANDWLTYGLNNLHLRRKLQQVHPPSDYPGGYHGQDKQQQLPDAPPRAAAATI